MIRGRSFLRYLCIAGLLTCIVAVIAPAAYGGEGIIDDATASVPVDTSGVTEVAETVPALEDVTNEVSSTTATVTETSNETVDQVPVSTQEPAEVVEDATTSSVAVTTSAPEAPSAPATAPTAATEDASSSASDGGATTSGGNVSSASSGSTSQASTGESTSTGSTATTSGGVAESFDTFTGWAPPAERGALSGTTFVSAQSNNAEEILDELLEIGNSVGADQVRGLQITSSRGEAAVDAPSTSPDASAPAPLALTGVAIGAFLMIGLLLLAVGSGARAAGSIISA
jgi:hypothetical protein